MKTKTSGGGRL